MKPLIWPIALSLCLVTIIVFRSLLAMFIIVNILVTLATWLWWALDLKDRSWDPESAKYYYYVVNNPSNLLALLRYLKRRRSVRDPKDLKIKG